MFEIDPRPLQAMLDQAKGDLAKAQGQLSQANAQLNQAQANLTQAEANQGKTQADVNRYTPLAREKAISTEQRSAEENLEAQHALVYAARAAYFPRISLTGFFGFQSGDLSNLFSGPGATWNFLPQIAQPLFVAGALKSNVKLAKAQREYALAQYQQAIQVAFREVSDALVQYRKVKEVRAQQELLVITLRDRSRLSYLRYQGGVDTLLNALDADRDLFSAELSLTQTRRNELLSLVQLYKALGGGWQQ